MIKSTDRKIRIVFFIVFILFLSLVIKLGNVQIIDKEFYKGKMNQTFQKIIETPTPRGMIYDRNGVLITGLRPVYSITYTRGMYERQEKRLEVAKKLANYIEQPLDKVTTRDKKDYWILTRREEANKLITKEEMATMTDQEYYQMQLKRITDKELSKIPESELEVLAIKREMDRAMAYSSQPIKKDGVTQEEVARVSENLINLPGIDISIDWNRNYPFKGLMRPLLGYVSTSEQGIPESQLNDYLELGYKRNDRVGLSYIESVYEMYLQGEKNKVQLTFNQDGVIKKKETVQEGNPGKDIMLTIDILMQREIEKVVEEELIKAVKKGGNELLDRAFVVVMNPNTGEILSMVGKKISKVDNGYVTNDYSIGNFATQYAMGSVVKGAMVLTGYEQNAIKLNDRFLDEPLKIQGTREKGSYIDMGLINDTTALKLSSNVYMFKTAIEIAGAKYEENKPLNIGSEAFDLIRNSFEKFGLGSKTEINLPNESIGLKGEHKQPGLLLDLSIGQYDTYTPLQLAQYISTIANNGRRMEPILVKEVLEEGKTFKNFESRVIEELTVGIEQIEHVKEGFRQVVQEKGGTAYVYFKQSPYNKYDVAGKTGTAETHYYGPLREKWGEPIYNLTFVGYAPSEKPEIAFSVVVPWANDKQPINKYISREIAKIYFEGKKDKYEDEYMVEKES